MKKKKKKRGKGRAISRKGEKNEDFKVVKN